MKRKGTLQLLEEFAIPYKAPKYKFKKATPELLVSIREGKRKENNRSKIVRYTLAGICTAISIVGLWLLLNL